MKTVSLQSLIITIVLISGAFAGAQQPATAAPKTTKSSANHASRNGTSPGEKPSVEQVTRLLDLLQVRDNLQITLDAMKAQMKNGAVETFRERIPVPSAAQLKALNDIVEEAFKDISMDDLIRDVVPVYQKHLSRSDVAALIAFYTSPVGQRLRREQPAMMRESMQVTSAGQQQKMERLLARVEVRVQQLIEQEQPTEQPEKK